jgi:WD40 repeat protein
VDIELLDQPMVRVVCGVCGVTPCKHAHLARTHNTRRCRRKPPLLPPPAAAAAATHQRTQQDCCFSQAAPLLASGLVNGQIMLHRFSSSGEPAAEQDEDEDDEPGAATTSNNSISVQEVLSRSSKKGASCRALCFTTGEQQQLVAGFATGTLLLLDAGSGRVAGRLTKAHSAGVNRLLALQGQPGLVAAGDDAGGLRVWDLRSSSQAAVYSYSRHTDFIGGLTQHGGPGKAQQQQALLAVSGDGTLSVHDLRSSKALAHSETDADDELLSGGCVWCVCRHRGISRCCVVCPSGCLPSDH